MAKMKLRKYRFSKASKIPYSYKRSDKEIQKRRKRMHIPSNLGDDLPHPYNHVSKSTAVKSLPVCIE